MSMDVDLTTPLTAEERRYLLMRGRHQDVERADEQHGTSGTDEELYGDGTAPVNRPLLTGERAAQRKEELLRELAELEAAEADGEDDEELPPYAEWPGAELDKELKLRGLPTSGTKSDKAARLDADDEAREAANQQ